MENVDIATALDRVADLLELTNANPFRVRAYRNGARVAESLGEPLRRRVEAGDDLRELDGIGNDLAGYIEELVKTGDLQLLRELRERVPESLVDVTRLEGIGPKKASRLWQELGVTSLADLQRAAEGDEIRQLDGFGAKTQQAILDRIADLQATERRHRLVDADRYVEALERHLKGHQEVERWHVAGSWRRRKGTVGDLDVLVTTRKGSGRSIIDHFTSWDSVDRVIEAGDTRASAVLGSGLQVDLRVLPPESFGAALIYFTGSKAHNLKLRRRALGRRLHLSEYGLFRAESGVGPSAGERLAGTEESDVYAALDLPWLPPELREDRGELEAAEAGDLPELIEEQDIRGDLQLHSTWTDGKASLRDMLLACRDRGYEYLAITDHSQAMAMMGGLDEHRLRQQQQQMEQLRAEFEDIRLLSGIEVDITKEGQLDLSDEALESVDIVLASVHSHLELSPKEQTRRLLRALDHPSVNILGHPTSRLLGKRGPMEFDLDDVLHAAKEQGVAVEHDAAPERLDLSDRLLLRAREVGVKLVINSDAHSTRALSDMRYGVEQARRAWVSREQVLNTRPLNALFAALRR